MRATVWERFDFKAILWVVWAILAPAAVADAAATPRLAIETLQHAYGPRVQLHEFSSTTLGEKKRFAVVLPANYDARKADWPVLLLLHGLGRNEQTLLKDETTRATLLRAPFAIVSLGALKPATERRFKTSQLGSCLVM